MRIISGLYKGRKIFEPTDNLTRPLKDLVRESIFNILEAFLIGVGKKYADSNKIFFVVNSVPDLVPPIIPPTAKILVRNYPLTMDFFAWHLVVDAVLVTGIVSWIVYKNRSKK